MSRVRLPTYLPLDQKCAQEPIESEYPLIKAHHTVFTFFRESILWHAWFLYAPLLATTVIIDYTGSAASMLNPISLNLSILTPTDFAGSRKLTEAMRASGAIW